jgi:hypothetical protein
MDAQALAKLAHKTQSFRTNPDAQATQNLYDDLIN